MVFKVCCGCKTENSWRYHSPQPDLIEFCKILFISFQISPSTPKDWYLCHACYGSLLRTKEYISKIQASVSQQATSSRSAIQLVHVSDDHTSTILPVKHVSQQAQSSATQVEHVSDDHTSTILPVKQTLQQCSEEQMDQAGDRSNEVKKSKENHTEYINTTTGLKRSYQSDHSYFGGNQNEHDYSQLYGQAVSDDEDNDLDDADTLQKLHKILPQTPDNIIYDYPSVLRQKDVTDIIDDDIFSDVIEEMIEWCPNLLQAMMSVAIKKKAAISMKHIASIVVAYSCLMFARYNRNSAIQKCLTLMAVKGNANDQFIRRLNHLSLTLSCSGKIKLLEKAKTTTRSKLVEAVRVNPQVKITGDNLDMYIRTNHQRQDNQNQDIHWFASNITFSRLDYTNITNEKPNIQVENIKPETFLINESEASKLKDVKKVMIGRIIGEKDQFKWILKHIPTHIPHRHAEYMSKKQEIFGLPVIFKNESKNEDCLDIMDAYETELIAIFNEAHGNLTQLERHGAVLGGDQLTRERLQNVKNIRSLALSPAGRFQHLNPIICEMWHVKQDLLSKAYKALFKTDSLERGTLHHIKVILRRSDVTGKVKSNYKAHEELMLLMVKGLVCVAADEESCLTRDRDNVLNNIYSRLHGEKHGNDDMVLNYYVNLITWGLQILNLNDMAKEGDLERMVTNCKENIPFFYGHSVYSKYFSEMVNVILLSECILSPEMKLRMLEGSFINTKGGQGKNKEADLVQEHSIRNKKDLIRSLGANKTEKAVTRACSAADTCFNCERNVDKLLGLPKMSVNHTKKSSSKDLETVIKLLKQVQPFQYEKGRKFSAFSKIPKNPKMIVPADELLKGLRKKIFRLFLNHY